MVSGRSSTLRLWGCVAMAAALLGGCVTDDESPSAPPPSVTPLPDEARERLASAQAIHVVGRPEGFTVEQVPRTAGALDDWVQAAATRTGCRLRLRATQGMAASLEALPIREPSYDALAALIEETGGTEVSEAGDLLVVNQPAMIEAQTPLGFNFASTDWSRTAEDGDWRVRGAVRQQNTIVLLYEGADYLAQITAALLFECPGDRLDESAWQSLLPTLRASFLGDQEELGAWRPLSYGETGG